MGGFCNFFKDGDEWSMRRLIAFWSMGLITIHSFAIVFGIKIDTTIFSSLCLIAGVGTGVSAIKNKKNV